MTWARIRNRSRLLTHYVARRARLGAWPIAIIIENTSRCNLKCPMCPREFGYLPPGDIDFGLFKRLIDELRGHSELVFPWGGGEPLLNRDLFRMIRYCRDARMTTVVSTNATLLDEAAGQQLIESELDQLIIAFDGTTREVYERYRIGAKFDVVRQNILRFLDLKRASGRGPAVVLQMVRLPENQHQVAEFRRQWRIPGVDEVRVKEDEIVIADVALEERKHHRRRRNPCYLLWQGPPTVNSQGDFFPCCYTWRSRPLGNVKESSVFDLWNSPAMERLRRAHLDGDLKAYPECRDCHAPNPRWPVILGTFAVDTSRVRQWIPRVERWAERYRLPVFRDR